MSTNARRQSEMSISAGRRGEMSISALSQPAQPALTQTTSWAPTAKISAGVLAAAVTTLILSFWHAPSASQGAALTTVITFLIQYFVPERK